MMEASLEHGLRRYPAQDAYFCRCGAFLTGEEWAAMTPEERAAFACSHADPGEPRESEPES
jgi:hypothetical protein